MRTLGTAFALVLAASSMATASEEREQHFAAVTIGDSSDVERAEDGTPIAFKMWSAGLNRTDHGDHVFTKESAEKLIAEQAERGNLFSFDVDHLSLSETAPPEARKAVGWFKIDVRDGDLWAVDVTWTDAVRAGLTKDPPEWRYFSPAYETKKKTGEIVRLLNCALTNNPATHNVTALATVASFKETPMDYEKMTLAALLAAMDEEKDEEKRSAMEKCARAKIKAAFPDEKEEPKKEPEAEKKEEKKASEGEGEKKEEKKASADDETEAKAATVADLALARVEAGLKAREETSAKEKILAALSAGDRETYKDLTLAQLERVVARHHADVLTRFASAGSAMPSVQGGEVGSTSSPDEREALAAEMGIASARPVVEMSGELLIFNPGTPAAADRFLASLASERSKGVRDGEALTRVLATQKAGSR